MFLPQWILILLLVACTGHEPADNISPSLRWVILPASHNRDSSREGWKGSSGRREPTSWVCVWSVLETNDHTSGDNYDTEIRLCQGKKERKKNSSNIVELCYFSLKEEKMKPFSQQAPKHIFCKTAILIYTSSWGDVHISAVPCTLSPMQGLTLYCSHGKSLASLIFQGLSLGDILHQSLSVGPIAFHWIQFCSRSVLMGRHLMAHPECK